MALERFHWDSKGLFQQFDCHIEIITDNHGKEKASLVFLGEILAHTYVLPSWIYERLSQLGNSLTEF
jgi:hypothetical protein